MLDTYLYELQRGGPLRKPSPSFAYELVNKKSAPKGRRGRYPGPTPEKMWKGIPVDKSLKDKWLNDLASIPNVEIRGTCCGHGPVGGTDTDWVTYVAFRVDPSFESKRGDIVAKLNKQKNVIAGVDIGQQGRPRFVVAAPFYYKSKRHSEWEQWWNSISRVINNSVNR